MHSLHLSAPRFKAGAIACALIACGLAGHAVPAGSQTTGAQLAALHKKYDALLQKYVTDFGVRYGAWHENAADRSALKSYIAGLAVVEPDALLKNQALAYWINLYNALTLDLILDHFPVGSIRELGKGGKTPWQLPRITIAGRELSLDKIEHDIIRKKFKDARIHFAVNCAARGCPPLAAHAFFPDQLDQQLDAAAARTINHPNWVKISDSEIRVTRIFDWFKGDFAHQAGSVREFIAKYRKSGKTALRDPSRRLVFNEYNWALNLVEK